MTLKQCKHPVSIFGATEDYLPSIRFSVTSVDGSPCESNKVITILEKKKKNGIWANTKSSNSTLFLIWFKSSQQKTYKKQQKINKHAEFS